VIFGLVALFLAGLGIYGVLAYMVAQRTKEIGIRMAVGSTPEGIFRLILTEGFIILAIGFVCGLSAAIALGKYVRSLLYGVQPTEPQVLLSVTAVLAIVALAACILPARRATRIDPIIALRCE
jgi:ABC-type antimicrobial peptide transport system permease subunit